MLAGGEVRGRSRASTVMVKIQWDREETAFISVAPVARAAEPAARAAKVASRVCTTRSWTPSTKIPPEAVTDERRS